MKERKSILKITTVAIFFVLVFASVVQAIIKINIDVEKETLPNEKGDILNEGLKGSSSWEDHFNDESKIDPSPPGAGASDNYVVDSGEVKMINTYSIWTDPVWTRMKLITVTNNGVPVTDYAINFTVDYDSEMQSDYDDIRFKHEDYPTTWLDYWIEEKDASSATVWVEVPSLQNGQSMMYLFYGNPSATSQSDFNSVFNWQDMWTNDEKITNHLNNEGTWDPDVCYGNGEFIIAWEEGQAYYPPYTWGFKQEIRASIYDIQGNKLVDDRLVFKDSTTWHRNENPSIDYGEGKWFVAWEHYDTVANPSATTMDIKARTVQRSGSGLQLGSVINVCTASNCQADANVEFDSVNNRFCVVWEDARNGMSNYNIYGRLYDTNGNTVGSEKTICSAANTQCEPWVAFDTINEQYMIVWEDGLTPDNGPFSIKAGLFDKDLNQVGNTISIATGTSTTDYNFPCVAFCEETERFLITWNDGDISSGDWHGNVWGTILNSSGNTVISTFQISGGEYIRTDIVPYLSTLFFVSYDDNNKIRGKLVTSEGDVFAGEVQLSASSSAEADWANMAVGDGKIFTAWEDTRITYTPPWNHMPDVFGNIWSLNMPSGTDVSYVFGNEKELILVAHVTSIKIEPLNLAYWDEFTEVSSRGDIVFDILDGNTGIMILHDISSGWDLSGISAPSIRLMATFSRTNPSSSPAVDMWGVSYYINSPPNIPSNPDPSNGAVNVDIDEDLSWTGGDPDPGDTVTYDVYFGTISSPPKMVDNQSATSYDPGTLNFGSTYYWKIVAWDSYGASTAGSVWSFTTRFNNPPYTPNNPDPPNGAVNVNLDADLSWSGGDPDGDTVTYDVYFGTTSPPPKVITNQSNATYDPGPLNHNTTYYWKIVSWDEYGATTAGSIWHFTTRANSPPNTPSAPSPSNGAVNVDLNEDLSWTGGDPDPGDTVTYDVYFGTISSPPKMVDNQSATSYDPGTLNFGSTYYWKIVAWDSYGASTAGSVWSFTTRFNNPPYTPNNPDPPNGAANVDLNADLSWDGGDPDPGDTVTYDVYFGTANPPPKAVNNQSTTTYNPGTLNFSTTYYWRIVAWDNHGATSSGPIWNFTTGTNYPPNIPSNPHPGNGETNVPIEIDLSWTGGDPNPGDTVTYDVYFGTTSPPTKVSVNQSGTTYDPGTLSYNTTYYWQIVAWDDNGASAPGSIWEFTTGEEFNQPPNTPSIRGSDPIIPGVVFVRPNTEYEFTIVTSDSDGDDVYYWVDWGDNSNSGWLGPNPTSVEIITNHTWSQPISLKFVKVKAKDIYGAESGWGYLIVIVNYNMQSYNQVMAKQGSQSYSSTSMSRQSNASCSILSRFINLK